MSDDEADAMMEELEKKWDSKHRYDFLNRMEKKLNHREKFSLKQNFR